MTRIWIVNASPLITLARAGRIDLLLKLCPDPIIPPAVSEEIREGRESDPARRWILGAGASFIGDPIPTDPRVAGWDLGAGETAVLSVARAHPGSEAILDDRAARNCAQALGISARGTLGIIVLAKREGLVDSAAPIFDDLVRAGLRVDPTTLERALMLAGEAPP